MSLLPTRKQYGLEDTSRTITQLQVMIIDPRPSYIFTLPWSPSRSPHLLRLQRSSASQEALPNLNYLPIHLKPKTSYNYRKSSWDRLVQSVQNGVRLGRRSLP